MIGDADGYDNVELHYTKEELEEELPLIVALNKLNNLKGYWNRIFSNYPEEYPGKYIGVSKKEYSLIIREINNPKTFIGNNLYSEREMYWVSFQGIDITYVDENNAEHNVKYDTNNSK